MAEIRFEVPVESLAVLGAYVQATGKSRASVMLGLLTAWSADKAREARMVLNVLGRNPFASESNRSHTGVIPESHRKGEGA